MPERTIQTHPRDLVLCNHGSVILLHPLTQAARDWLAERCPPDDYHVYCGDALAVEPRYLEYLLLNAVEDRLVL